MRTILGCVGRWRGAGTHTDTRCCLKVTDEVVISDLGQPYLVFERLITADTGVLAMMTGFFRCAGPGRVRAGIAFAGGYVNLAEGEVARTDDGGFEAHLLADAWSQSCVAPMDATEMWIGCHGDALTLDLDVLMSSGVWMRTKSVLARA